MVKAKDCTEEECLKYSVQAGEDERKITGKGKDWQRNLKRTRSKNAKDYLRSSILPSTHPTYPSILGSPSPCFRLGSVEFSRASRERTQRKDDKFFEILKMSSLPFEVKMLGIKRNQEESGGTRNEGGMKRC